MIMPCKGGFGLRVFALLTLFVAALSGFGQGKAQVGVTMPPVVQSTEPGFKWGVQESDGTLMSQDVTGSPVINPYASPRTGFDYVRVRGSETAHMSDSTTAVIQSGVSLRPLLGISDDLRRFHQGAPANAVFQAGPLFVQVHDVTASLLVSDNVNFTSRNAQWGAIAQLKTRLSGILQIAPTWRLVVSGSIIYLPFDNEFGVEGFGIGDFIGFIADERLAPVTHFQLAYNSDWADWNVQMVDDFSVRYLTVGAEYDPAVRGVAQPEGIHASDEAGRYVFQNGTTIPNTGIEQRQSDFLNVRTFLQLENLVAGSASRMLPTETRMTFGASHSDYWYHGDLDGGTNGLGFSASSADRVFATLRNERESMRFKPYAYYDAYRYNYDPDWTQQVGAGIAGPITDYLGFSAEGGYTWGGVLLKNTETYRFRLINNPRPSTRQELTYSRYVTEPVRETRDLYRYDLSQGLRRDMWARFYVQRAVYFANQPGVFGSVEDRMATRIVYQPTIKHSVIIGGSYAENRFSNPGRDRETIWEARAEVRYYYTPTLLSALLYRYENVNTRQGKVESDIGENLWLLTVRKLF